jgi:hypothetical protein
MQVLGTLMIGLIALTALIFVSLLFFRRSRPELQAQLFSWLVRSTMAKPPGVIFRPAALFSGVQVAHHV